MRTFYSKYPLSKGDIEGSHIRLGIRICKKSRWHLQRKPGWSICPREVETYFRNLAMYAQEMTTASRANLQIGPFDEWPDDLRLLQGARNRDSFGLIEMRATRFACLETHFSVAHLSTPVGCQKIYAGFERRRLTAGCRKRYCSVETAYTAETWLISLSASAFGWLRLLNWRFRDPFLAADNTKQG